VATNCDARAEPMLFFLAFAQRPDSYPTAKRQPLKHGSGLRGITRVEFESPHADELSTGLRVVRGSNLVRLRAGMEFLVELGFDGELQGSQVDFRPELPLVLFW
jgi:hypothetical protein